MQELENINEEFDFNKEKYPSDIAYFKNKKTLTDDEKNFILAKGPCRPILQNFPKTNNRCFSTSYYKSLSVSGMETENEWLCYSPKLDIVYCEPCWLFQSSRHAKHSNWSTGINDWQGLSKKIKIHNNSEEHQKSCLAKNQWKQKKFDLNLESSMIKEQLFWTKVLERYVKIILKLAINSNSFRGHNESNSSVCKGNFLDFVDLLAEYDDVLREVVNMPKGKTKYLSPHIQNELIEVLGNQVRANLVGSINSAPCFSIILDTTQDLSKVDQLSIVLRYMEIKKVDNLISSFTIKESFLGFFKVSNQTAEGLTTQVLKFLENQKIDIHKCRGQGYDGANTMSGAYSGVQKRIKNIEKNAIFVHCAAHNLNLVINDTVKAIPEINNFFADIQNIYVFFGLSIERWDILSNITGESTITLKKLNPTRWSGRLQSCLAVKIKYTEIIKALSKIMLQSTRDIRDKSLSILNKIKTFDFIITLSLITNILSLTNQATKVFQATKTDLVEAANILENICNDLNILRKNFDTFLEESKCVAEKWGIPPIFEDKRKRTIKNHFDELAVDHRFADSVEIFKIKIFYRAIDMAYNQIVNRFKGMQTVANLFKFLQPIELLSKTEKSIIAESEKLLGQYKNDIGPAFALQIVMFRKTFEAEIKKCHSIRDLLEIIIKYPELYSSYSEVKAAIIIFLTIPVTSATAERSFSKLKLIKSYLRTTMGQERLSSLGLIAIESLVAKEMDTNETIQLFASNKCRQKNF